MRPTDLHPKQMMRRSRVAILLIVLVASSCQRASRPVPQFLDESAKQDLDRANIVVLAKVNGVSDRDRHQEGKYRLIELALDVQLVIKGDLDSRTPCARYYALKGGFVGHLPVWVEPGSTGIFFLTNSSPCLRAVNDNRAYVRTFGTLPTARQRSAEKLIAGVTLPQGCAGNSYVYNAQQDVWAVTIPLVGSRAARKLMVGADSDNSRSVEPCSCLVAALVWKLPESCLTSLTPRDGIREQAHEIRNSNDALNFREEQELRDNPAAWLETTVEAWGMDGALLRLGGLMSSSGSGLSQGACSALRARRESSSFGASLKGGRDRSNATAESAALGQFDQWTNAGCQPNWQVMEGPVIDP